MGAREAKTMVNQQAYNRSGRLGMLIKWGSNGEVSLTASATGQMRTLPDAGEGGLFSTHRYQSVLPIGGGQGESFLAGWTPVPALQPQLSPLLTYRGLRPV